MRSLVFLILIGSFGVLASLSAQAQSGGVANVEQAASYVSQIDEELTLRRVAILPVSDNVEGIYARPVEAQLNLLMKNSHRWDLVDSSIAGSIPSVIELEESPTEVLRITRGLDADAIIGAAVSRGPNGLSIRMNLFSKRDGRILSQELLKNHPRYELPEIREQVTQLYKRMVARIPYAGLILSRQQNRVTINLGKSDGLTKEQVITAVQIISINRHPKFGFIVSSEKEILGRIKILKVDETLSFGAIIAEKERGAIRKFAKVSGLQQVTYPEPTRFDEGAGPGDLATRPDANVTFGKDPKEWLPVKPPSFGQVGMKLGIGNYTSSMNLSTGEALAAKSSLYPSLGLNGEMWLTPEWIVRAEMTQGVIVTSNPRAGSSPSTLNQSMSRYSLEFGYNFLLRDDFFGPKLFMTGGYSLYRMYVDDSSPRGLTTVNYSGFLVGLGGSFPIAEDKIWYVNGRLHLFLMAALEESPVTSGSSSKSTINDFALGVDRRIGQNFLVTGSVEISLYSSTFSGVGTRSSTEYATTLSQNHLGMTGGLTYMF